MASPCLGAEVGAPLREICLEAKEFGADLVNAGKIQCVHSGKASRSTLKIRDEDLGDNQSHNQGILTMCATVL